PISPPSPSSSASTKRSRPTRCQDIRASMHGGPPSRRGPPLPAPISAHSSIPEQSTLRKIPIMLDVAKHSQKSHADGKILQSIDDGVGVITFNNAAKRNAMSLEMWEGLGHALTELRDDPAVRVVG